MLLSENIWVNYVIAGLLPDDPNFIVRHNLRMTCQLYSAQYHARDLRFEFHLYHGSELGHRRKLIQASAHDIYLVNASVVELNYTRVTSRFDRATVVCYHRQRHRWRELDARQIIKVGREWFLFANFAVCAVIYDM